MAHTVNTTMESIMERSRLRYNISLRSIFPYNYCDSFQLNFYTLTLRVLLIDHLIYFYCHFYQCSILHWRWSDKDRNICYFDCL